MNTKIMTANSFLFMLCCIFSHWCCSLADESIKQTNLLFLIFDDLRPELSIYGRKHMITPNFERLAKRSVIFDYAYTQVSVCNPARDAILTGLRPDSTGTYNFQHTFYPHLSFPTEIIKSGYNSAGIGKIRHWDKDDKLLFNYEFWQGDWYPYQNLEREMMNASSMPDKTRTEKEFRDYGYTTRAIDVLRRMVKEPQYYMLSLGFKNPHMAVHVPYEYYAMYQNKTDMWKLTKKELRYPASTPEVPYKCCAEFFFKYIQEEGTVNSKRIVSTRDLGFHAPVPEDMYNELMIGYAAAVTYVDKQLGRVLDVLDELQLWNNLTVVLTADHGMHNGEKGIWEKWSLFEESTRVPLLIAHPATPFAGQHYSEPVESVDIYPTIVELLKLPVSREVACVGFKCKPLQGKSLVPVIMGQALWESDFKLGNTVTASSVLEQEGDSALSSLLTTMPKLKHNFAISQVLRCALYKDLSKNEEYRQYRQSPMKSKATERPKRATIWHDCDTRNKTLATLEQAIMGYSMRTPNYRYTAYFYFNQSAERPLLNTLPYEEELYDHKNETLADFTHREIVNLAYRPTYTGVVTNLRIKLMVFLRDFVKYGDHS